MKMSQPFEEHKNFMQGKQFLNFTNLYIISVEFTDPLKKREQFAVSLRKEKTKEIIREKRRKIMESLQKQQAFLQAEPNVDQMDPTYNGWFNFNSKDPNNIQSGACY